MRSVKLAILAVVVAALLPATAAADPVTKADRANAARACKQLRTTLGPLFAQTYTSSASAYGKCVSAWTQAAHATRHSALEACKASGKKGLELGVCVASRVVTQVTAQVTSTKNAAKECAAERDQMGKPAFNAKYGANDNDANAFGKCVSSKRSNSDAQPTRLTADLTGTVGSGSFTARINVKKRELCYTLRVTGLTSVTGAHIHVKPSGDIVVPLDAPTDGSSSGCVTVQLTLLQQILASPSTYYVNVHTTAAPAGAIKGDLQK